MSIEGRIVWHEIGHDLLGELVARGHRLRNVFPHRVLHLAKGGPDAYKLATRMRGPAEPASLREIVLYADESMLTEFPADVFFDDDLVWHQQHFGLPGQIATANAVLDGDTVWSTAHTADVIQRIGRRRELKTRIEKRFNGWHDMLLNALLSFAAERGARRVLLPTARLAMTHTDPARTVGPELFERVYDRDVNRLFRPERAGEWWAVDVAAHTDLVVKPRVRPETIHLEKTICLCHDVEAGLGHVGIDEELVRLADATWRANLREMLAIERDLGLHGTYNVVGTLLPEIRDEVESGGHCLAFHSYDHGEADQLARCRRVDYRLKGYRPPRSLLSPELEGGRLLLHNFEWLASSTSSLGTRKPVLSDSLVRIPVHFDDFPLYRSGMAFEEWEADALRRIAEDDPVVLSLHDCYAHLWLNGYACFLERIARLGKLRTLDEVAAAVTLAASE